MKSADQSLSGNNLFPIKAIYRLSGGGHWDFLASFVNDGRLGDDDAAEDFAELRANQGEYVIVFGLEDVGQTVDALLGETADEALASGRAQAFRLREHLVESTQFPGMEAMPFTSTTPDKAAAEFLELYGRSDPGSIWLLTVRDGKDARVPPVPFHVLTDFRGDASAARQREGYDAFRCQVFAQKSESVVATCAEEAAMVFAYNYEPGPAMKEGDEVVIDVEDSQGRPMGQCRATVDAALNLRVEDEARIAAAAEVTRRGMDQELSPLPTGVETLYDIYVNDPAVPSKGDQRVECISAVSADAAAVEFVSQYGQQQGKRNWLISVRGLEPGEPSVEYRALPDLSGAICPIRHREDQDVYRIAVDGVERARVQASDRDGAISDFVRQAVSCTPPLYEAGGTVDFAIADENGESLGRCTGTINGDLALVGVYSDEKQGEPASPKVRRGRGR